MPEDWLLTDPSGTAADRRGGRCSTARSPATRRSRDQPHCRGLRHRLGLLQELQAARTPNPVFGLADPYDTRPLGSAMYNKHGSLSLVPSDPRATCAWVLPFQLGCAVCLPHALLCARGGSYARGMPRRPRYNGPELHGPAHRTCGRPSSAEWHMSPRPNPGTHAHPRTPT